MRDNFSEEVKRVIADRVGYRCSNPDCRALTSGPQIDETKALNVGVAAHISAASAGGPRYNQSISSQERRHLNNGIWLCQNCAKLIDNDLARFPESLLRKWKQQAEKNALAEIGKTGKSFSESQTETVEYVIWETLEKLQTVNTEVTSSMLIDAIESIDFKYIRAVTIISVLQSMRRRGQITWNGNMTDLLPSSTLRINPAWLDK
jgi:hypothetical protein